MNTQPSPIFNGRPGETVPQFQVRREAEFAGAGEVYAPPLPPDPSRLGLSVGRGWAS